MKRFIVSLIVCSLAMLALADIPDNYYNSTIEHKNSIELELALKAIVNPHTHISYDNLWKKFETTDVVPADLLKDPAKTDQVYDMYANINTFTKYYSDNDHTQTGGINREHCVPNSWWGGESGNAIAYTDLHHLVPSDGAANNAKSNHPLGEYQSGMTLSWPTETKTNTNGYTYVIADNTADHSGSWSHVWNTTSSTKVFEPADEFKGDFARMYLYVVCAYEGDLNWQTEDNTMFSNGTTSVAGATYGHTEIAPWAKALLLKWHRQDPVSEKERLRNNAVQSIQGNRNPFIDYPILVEYIWGDSIAKTSFTLDMTSVTPGAPDTPETPGSAALYFPHIAKLGQPFAEPAFTTNSDGAQTWTSSNTAVADVDNHGKVTIKAVGTTIITVTQAETDTYTQGSASYMIKVIE